MGRSYSPDKTELDPLFTIPIGAEDEFTYNKDYVGVEDEFDNSTEDVIEGVVDMDADIEYYDEDTDGVAYNELEVPSEFSIIFQTVRRAPGGYQVIDIVIQTEDIYGATNYEVRVTKT